MSDSQKSVFDELEQESNILDTALLWKGTFREFLQKYETEKNDNANIGVLAHQRVYNMIMAGETKRLDHFGKERTRYSFFEDSLYGIEDSIDAIMSYFHSAAQRTETSRRMLLMYGPPSTGKSQLVQLLKQGLESYTRTKEGAIFALAGSKMHENPFLLIPEKLRPDFEKQYGLRIEGKLSPSVVWMLREEFHGKFMDFPVEQLYLDEASRRGIGTWLPQDPKTVSTATTKVLIEGKGIVRLSSLFASVCHKKDADGFSPLSGTFLTPGPDNVAIGALSVSSLDQDLRIKGIYDHGNLPMFRVNAGGVWIDCTAKHRFMTLNEAGEFEWEAVRDIDDNTPVLIKTNMQKFGHSPTLFSWTKSDEEDAHPTCLTPQISEIVGGLVAEGACTGNNFFYCNTDESLVNRFVKLIEGVFSVVPTICSKSVCDDGEVAFRGVSLSARITRWLERNFNLSKGACDKAVPDVVLQSCKSDQIAFLEGLFLGDGSIRFKKNRVARFSYATCSETLAMDVQFMLLNLGIFTRISYYTDKIYPLNTQYQVVSEGQEVYQLAEMFPEFSSHRKFSRAVLQSEATEHRPKYEFFGSLSGLISEIRDNTKGTRELIDRRYTIKTANSRSPTRPTLLKWYKELNTNVEWICSDRDKRRILEKLDVILSYRCVKILSTEYLGIQHGVDLACSSDPFAYIANGFVSHNSQDQSELVGSIDFAKIQEYGDEADPRCYNFNGELNVANRGIMEFVEGMKCILHSSLIPTDQGFVSIGSLHGEARDPEVAHETFVRVNSGRGTGSVIRSCYKGKANCLEVTTSKGYVIRGSQDHRVLVFDNEFIWKSLKDLDESDSIVISKDSVWSDSDVKIPDYEKPQKKWTDCGHNRKLANLPEYMTSELARFMGYFIAEGSFSYHKDVPFSARITNIDQEVIDDVNYCVSLLGLDCKRYDKDCVVHSVQLCQILNRLGIQNKCNAHNKVVPWSILQSGKQIVANFLRAYFDGDGTVGNHKISATTASLNLSEQIQQLLLNFGIVSKRFCYRGYWNIEISSIYFDKFMQEIGFNIARKRQKAQSSVRRRINHRETVPNSSKIFKTILGDLQQFAQDNNLSICPKTRRHSFSESSYVVGRKSYEDIRRFSTGNSEPSVSVASNLAKECIKFSPIADFLKKCLADNLYFDKLSSTVEIGVQEVFDLHETVNHSYVSGGMIHHNSDERFLRVLLTATQEKAIKAPRFGFIYCDVVILLHSNEEEFRNFMAEKKYEAYHDRMIIVRVPYNMSVSNEIKIYEKLLANSDAIKNMHIAPKTLEAAAMFAVLTRLTPPPEGGDLTLVKKMKLYDKQHVRGYKIEQVPEMKKKDRAEGMSGCSPRFIIDQISASIANARDESRDYITPVDILRQLNKGVLGRDSFQQDKKNQYEALIDEARREWDDMLKNDIQKAFFVCYEDESRSLCENYLDQIEASCSGQKPRDPITGDEMELDEKLMSSVEEQISISESGKEDFRNEILRAVGTASRKHKKFDYTQHAQLKEAIQKKLFEERKNVIRMTVSTRNPETAELKRINEVVERLVDQQGYSVGSANALLKYASSQLFDR